MIRLHMVVEGQTEETFVNQMLVNHLGPVETERPKTNAMKVTIVLLDHLWRSSFMLRLHPTGYAQHERLAKTVHPERSAAKSKGEPGIFLTHLI
jgi:hypothetical protein